MPSTVLDEMMLRSAAVVPPIRLLVEPIRDGDADQVAAAGVPAAFVPRKLPVMTLFDDPLIAIPSPAKRLIDEPLDRAAGAACSQGQSACTRGRPALVPFSSMSGVPAKPGSVVPSMITASVMFGQRRTEVDGLHTAARRC